MAIGPQSGVKTSTILITSQVARILQFDPPEQLVLGEYRYHAKSGIVPAGSDWTTTFRTTPTGTGQSVLRVEQSGFPDADDEHYKACVEGWARTFDGINDFLRNKN
jgi:uncharacterized protein YndB with AHSA1/START domain